MAVTTSTVNRKHSQHAQLQADTNRQNAETLLWLPGSTGYRQRKIEMDLVVINSDN